MSTLAPPTKPAPSVGVYQLPDRYVISIYTRCDAGFSVACGVGDTVSAFASERDLGEVVLSALTKSRAHRVVRTPPRSSYRTLMRPTLSAAGVKSARELVRTAKLCEVSVRGDGVEVMPTKAGQGYEHLPDRTKQVTSPTSEELGKVLREVLQDC